MAKTETCDWQDDISAHLRIKNGLLRTRTEKFNYFSSLSQEFVVQSRDPDYVEYMNKCYGIIRGQIIGFLEENRDDAHYDHDAAEQNDTEDPDHDAVEQNDTEDPQYKVFLENFRVNGKAYYLEIAKDCVFVKYEAEDDEESPSGPSTECAHNINDVKTNHVTFETNETTEAEKNANIETNRVSVERNVTTEAEKRANATNYTGKRRGRPRKKLAADDTNVGFEAEKHAPKRRSREPKSAVKSECFNEVQGKSKDKKTANQADFRVKEEQEDYDSSKPLLEPVLNVEQWRRTNKVNSRKRSEFRDKLMEKLLMPYCEEEYERLLLQISDRKPVQNHKDLRGRIKIYQEDRPGKSFLDHHTDLAKRIDSVRDDHPRVLNLLRGFFYWVTNLSHEGAFLPWRDASCLEVLPQQ